MTVVPFFSMTLTPHFRPRASISCGAGRGAGQRGDRALREREKGGRALRGEETTVSRAQAGGAGGQEKWED